MASPACFLTVDKSGNMLLSPFCSIGSIAYLFSKSFAYPAALYHFFPLFNANWTWKCLWEGCAAASDRAKDFKIDNKITFFFIHKEKMNTHLSALNLFWIQFIWIACCSILWCRISDVRRIPRERMDAFFTGIMLRISMSCTALVGYCGWRSILSSWICLTGC